MSDEQGANDNEGGADLGLPWLAAPLRRALATQQGHAILVRGPGGVGEFELALALAQGWLCEATDRPIADRPCRRCASCKLFAARSHPDLLVLVPEVMREALGWELGAGESEEGGAGEASGKRKPSKEIRVEAVRAAIGFATTTPARGRGKAVIVHPAERMNEFAASAFLKTLEEPAGAARFVLCSARPDQLLPTIRSRCQEIVLPIPARDPAIAWLHRHGIDQPEVLLAASGGRPQEALRLADRGIDAAAWLALPARVAAGDAAALHGWPLPAAVDALQKLCHDSLSLACGAEPHYFSGVRLRGEAAIGALLRWWRELARVAAEVEHPWSVDLTVESLVGQGREALKTPRSRGSRGEALSLNSAR
jgi:DNA polymerase III subunit delta'